MPISYNEISKNSFGGTELQCRSIEKYIDVDLLNKFQIIPSRLRKYDENLRRIFYCHDLPEDPESKHLEKEGWKKFNRIVFVSHWQKQRYMDFYGIPPSKCVVMHNAIESLECDWSKFNKPEKIELFYSSTPHRGLNILVPVFNKLLEKHKNIHLHVYSSFEIYGWKQRDEEYKDLFEEIKNNKNMTYHGYISNDELKKRISKHHIFAYPSTWIETFAISLAEAMSAGTICVHSDLGALAETAANWTAMYSFHENVNRHAITFYNMLDAAIDCINNEEFTLLNKLKAQKSYVDLHYDWDLRKIQWTHFLKSIENEPIIPLNEITDSNISNGIFTYKVG